MKNPTASFDLPDSQHFTPPRQNDAELLFLQSLPEGGDTVGKLPHVTIIENSTPLLTSDSRSSNQSNLMQPQQNKWIYVTRNKKKQKELKKGFTTYQSNPINNSDIVTRNRNKEKKKGKKESLKVNQAEIKSEHIKPAKTEDDQLYANQTSDSQINNRRLDQRAGQFDLSLTQVPLNPQSRINSYLSSTIWLLASLTKVCLNWQQTSKSTKLRMITIIMLLLFLLVPNQSTIKSNCRQLSPIVNSSDPPPLVICSSYRDQSPPVTSYLHLNMDQDLEHTIEAATTPWPYSLMIGSQRTTDPQQPEHIVPSRGTESTISQPECQQTRLVSKLSSHKKVKRSAPSNPNLPMVTSSQRVILFPPILLGIFLHSSKKTKMPSKAQYAVYTIFIWSVSLCYFHSTSATETLNQFTMYDCGSTQISQPQIQQYSLNTPDLCSNASQIYYPPLRHQSIQVLQIPKFTPIMVHNCLIKVKTKVGYCGNSGFAHMAHAMRTLQDTIIFPSSLECVHAINKGEMQFTIPPFGSAKSSRITVPLTQGQASFEEYLKGYSTINSDCRGEPFTAPDDTYVAKAIVRIEGTISVQTKHARLIDDRQTLVITDKVSFNRQTAANRDHKSTGSSVTAHIYAQTKNLYEEYRDDIFGIFVANKTDIPRDACQTARSVWSSANVTFHKSKHIMHSDVIEITGVHTHSEHLSMILKSKTQVCNREVYTTAIQELFVLTLSDHDAPLEKRPIKDDELNQWIMMKSMLMSTVSTTELSMDQDFNQISFKICENNRQLLISQLRDIKSEGESLIFDVNGNPTLPIKSGELVYIFHCIPTQGRIRTMAGICSQELPIITTGGRKLFMKPTSRRLTPHYTPRVCSSITPAGYNLGTPTTPHWVYIDHVGNPYQGPTPKSFNFSQLTRQGIDLPDLKGLYTDEQMIALQDQTSRGDAIVSINNHLAARIIETRNNMFSFHTHLDAELQQALESSTTPFPYTMVNYIPHWLRVTCTAIFVIAFIALFAKPIVSFLLWITNSSMTFIDFLYTLFCGQAAAIKERIRANRAHQELIQRLDNVVGEEGTNQQALIPISDTTKMKQEIKDMKTELNKKNTEIRALVDRRTEANALYTKNHIKALEETVKKQAIQNKTLEGRLNKLEQPEPPVYSLSALSKTED